MTKKKTQSQIKLTDERRRINAEIRELERRLKERDGEDQWYKMQIEHEQRTLQMRELRLEREAQLERWAAGAIKLTTATSTVCACGAMFSYVLRDNADAGVVGLCLTLFSASMFALYASKHQLSR